MTRKLDMENPSTTTNMEEAQSCSHFSISCYGQA